jgi:hypothetical protein
MSKENRKKLEGDPSGIVAKVFKIASYKVGLALLVVCAAIAGVSQSSDIASALKVTDNPLISGNSIPGTPKSAPGGVEEYAAEKSTPRIDQLRQNGPANLEHLINGSELILRGLTKSVTDGIENGIPYTEVTVQVKEGIRGKFGSDYTFRQFGLIAPKKVDGRIFLAATPEGWAKYSVGEDVLLFLYPRASKTGLRTTAGLGQGKIKIEGGNARSQLNNHRLFDRLEVNASLSESDKRLLAAEAGAVNSDALVSFVRRAVNEKWIERKVMQNAKK